MKAAGKINLLLFCEIFNYLYVDDDDDDDDNSDCEMSIRYF